MEINTNIIRYYLLPDIGMMVRMFANGPGDWGSIPGRVIPKTKKIVLDASCLTLSIIRYGSWLKWSNPGKGVEPSPTPWCSSYQKESLLVALDHGRQLYLLFISKTHWNSVDKNRNMLSLSSCAGGSEFSDTLSPFISTIYCSWQVF